MRAEKAKLRIAYESQMKKILAALLLISGIVFGQDSKSPRRDGLVIIISGSNGPGLGYSSNYNSNIQIHSLVGYVRSEGKILVNNPQTGQQQNLEILVKGLSAQLGGRYYPIENLYLGTGLIYRVDRAKFDLEIANGVDSEKGSGMARVLALPINIGGEIARYSILSGYMEFSNLITLTNTKPGASVSSESLSVKYFNKFYEWKIGLGASINWGSIKAK